MLCTITINGLLNRKTEGLARKSLLKVFFLATAFNASTPELFQVVDTSSSLPLKPLNIFQPSRPTENT
jgi:hypothetical protein